MPNKCGTSPTCSAHYASSNGTTTATARTAPSTRPHRYARCPIRSPNPTNSETPGIAAAATRLDSEDMPAGGEALQRVQSAEPRGREPQARCRVGVVLATEDGICTRGTTFSVLRMTCLAAIRLRCRQWRQPAIPPPLRLAAPEQRPSSTANRSARSLVLAPRSGTPPVSQSRRRPSSRMCHACSRTSSDREPRPTSDHAATGLDLGIDALCNRARTDRDVRRATLR